MNFSMSSIIVCLITSLIGLLYVRYGRAQGDMSIALAGAVLMGYSYFIDSVLWLCVIGAVIAAAPFVWRRFH